MEFRTLKYFLAVAKELSMTKAAALLHVTQPALSRQIMQLEDELGAKLFIRSNHSIALTEHGKRFERRAQEIVGMIEKAKAEIADAETPKGELSIGCGDYKSSRLLARIMGGFRALYPDISYRIYSANADDIKLRIESGALDLGLIVNPADIRKYAFLKFPGRERYGIYVHARNPLAERESVAPKDLAGVPLALASRVSVIETVQNWFGDFAPQMNVAVYGNLPYNMLELVAEDIVAFCCIELDFSVPDAVFVPFVPALGLSTALVWKRLPMPAPALKSFVAFAEKFAEDEQKRDGDIKSDV